MEDTYLAHLGPEALATRGPGPGWHFGLADRVRFGEIDALNHVNHTVPLRWFENLRMLYLRDRGIAAYDGTGPEVVLRAISVRYDAPLFSAESYVVAARVPRLRTTSFTMELGVFAPDLRVWSEAVVVLVDPRTGAKAPLPEAARQRLISEGAVPAN